MATEILVQQPSRVNHIKLYKTVLASACFAVTVCTFVIHYLWHLSKQTSLMTLHHHDDQPQSALSAESGL